MPPTLSSTNETTNPPTSPFRRAHTALHMAWRTGPVRVTVPCLLLIGPEGGFVDPEVDVFKEMGAQVTSRRHDLIYALELKPHLTDV